MNSISEIFNIFITFNPLIKAIIFFSFCLFIVFIMKTLIEKFENIGILICLSLLFMAIYLLFKFIK